MCGKIRKEISVFGINVKTEYNIWIKQKKRVKNLKKGIDKGRERRYNVRAVRETAAG